MTHDRLANLDFPTHKFCNQLCTSSLQLGSKAKRSSTMYTVVLKEVIAYYSTRLLILHYGVDGT